MTPGADKADSVDVVHDVEERWIPLRTDNAFSSVRLTADKGEGWRLAADVVSDGKRSESLWPSRRDRPISWVGLRRQLRWKRAIVWG